MPLTRLVVLLAYVGAAAGARAQGCIDQSYATARSAQIEVSNQQTCAQTFMVTTTGLLTGVDVDVRHTRAASTFTLQVTVVLTNAGVPNGNAINAGTLQPSAVPQTAFALVPVRFATPVPVDRGMVLGLRLSSSSIAGQNTYAWSSDPAGSYAGGATFLNSTQGPLPSDQGFRTRITPFAGGGFYGVGHRGTNGVPTLTVSAAPVQGRAIQILVGNSAGITTAGVLLLGTSQANLPTPFGGTLLVTPLVSLNLPLPAAGAQLPVTIPSHPSACGALLYLQSLVVDAGASHGIAFSAGLRLLFGA
jgi:hypothetical protein